MLTTLHQPNEALFFRQFIPVVVLNNQRCRTNQTNRVLAGLILHLGLSGHNP